jgi:RNA polymerase sigma-70 factor (ECF subfamily)
VERYAFDQDYLERLASGDAETERHFASYFGQLLLIKLRGRLRNPQLVADLRQETFMRVFQAIRKRNAVMYPERLGSFVNSVCENVLLEFFRSDKANVHAQDELHEPSDEAATVESELISEERSALVRKILGEMSDSDRKILSGVFLEERDKDQLCLEMKIDRGNLRVRIHRALARFRSCLQNRELIANRSQAARRGA